MDHLEDEVPLRVGCEDDRDDEKDDRDPGGGDQGRLTPSSGGRWCDGLGHVTPPERLLERRI
jgi:hypothetical protein